MAKKSPIVRIAGRDQVYRDAPDGAIEVDVRLVTLTVRFVDGTGCETFVEGELDDTAYPVGLLPWSRKVRYGKSAGFLAEQLVRRWRSDGVMIVKIDGRPVIKPWHQVAQIDWNETAHMVLTGAT